MTKTTDIIIPTYKPDEQFIELLKRLASQTVKPNRIIIMNTDEEEWNKRKFSEQLIASGLESLCQLHHVTKAEFNHGRTRNIAVSYSNSDFFICMTQDALPKDNTLIEELISPLDKDIKLTYARQLPKQTSGDIEKFTRLFNYPDQDIIKNLKDVDKLGIKTYFAPNVCAAYDRETFDILGGFIDYTILNEDMIYAATLIKSGKSVKYCSKGKVFHSHDYTGITQFKRNFDIAVSHIEHPEVFAGLKSETEGIKLVKMTASYLKSHGKYIQIYKLIYISGCKYLGFLCGKHYKKLPINIIKKLSMNRGYWEN